jgi:hypothetical protein
MKTRTLIPALLTVLILAVPRLCCGTDPFEYVSKARAKELGLVVRSDVVGGVFRITLDFETKGELKHYRRVALELLDGEKLLVSSNLREDRSKPGWINVEFMLDSSYLDKATLRMAFGAESPRSASIIRLKEFVSSEVPLPLTPRPQAAALNSKLPDLHGDGATKFPDFLPGSQTPIDSELVGEVNAMATRKEQLQFLIAILPPVNQKEKLLFDRQLHAIRLLGLTDSSAAVDPLLDRLDFAHRGDGWPCVHALGRLKERSVESAVWALQGVPGRQRVYKIGAVLYAIKGQQYPKFIDELKLRNDIKLSDEVIQMLKDYWRAIISTK